MNILENWKLKQARRKLQGSASRLARDAHVFSEGSLYEVDLSRDAERLVQTAASVLRYAARVEALKETEENNGN